MVYQAGADKMQYRCTGCRLVSPHEGKCFRCGGIKHREKIPEIVSARNKGQSISVRVGG